MTADNERMIILDILLEVLENNQYSHLVIRKALAKYGYLPKNERAFISRVSRGCIEQMLELDAMIDKVSSVKTKKMKPVIRNILRMTAYQLKYTDVAQHAVCSEAVNLAKQKGFYGLARFVNAVSRNLARQINTFDFSAFPDIQYSVPKWLMDSFVKWYGEEKTKAMLENWKNQSSNGISVHLHTNLCPKEQILQSLLAQGVEAKEAPYAEDCYYLKQIDRIEDLEAFQNGWLQVQDISSALAAQAVSPENDSLCLDLCSAPGGKAVWMAEYMNNTGLVDCRDISMERLAWIEENKERCGLFNMQITCQDASILNEEDSKKFDYVLADVPCSGLGVIGKKPDIKYQLTREQMDELLILQRKILQQAMNCVKPGGILVYSTCTINPQENDDNVDYILQSGKFSMESLNLQLHTEIEGADLKSGKLQLLPGQNASDGFFVARLKRIKE